MLRGEEKHSYDLIKLLLKEQSIIAQSASRWGGDVFGAELKSKKKKNGSQQALYCRGDRLFIAEEIGIVSCAIK